ncbi:MAG: phosphopentomutase [Thermaerobacter sp.]|nr:phosphopentomutase [Thermaerobacter sp.]
MRRVAVIVLDSAGVGALPDAAAYGDAGANTLGHVAAAVGGLGLPHLGRLGLGNITPLAGVPPEPAAAGAFGRMALAAPGKDTLSGHWEMMGCIVKQPLRTFPHGFPPAVMEAFEGRIGRGTLGNRPASGTAIIAELGAQHLATGYPIVYTSADSVFQIAAHEAVVPVDELYRWCEAARQILQGPYLVGRVIARPFRGEPGAFYRTEGRRDFALAPPGPTVLDLLHARGVPVHAVGKINDIFSGRGISAAHEAHGNAAATGVTLELLERPGEGLIFTNLVDFDMLYGHRNDPAGYARALAEFDAALGRLQELLRPEELAVVTADHGCDPTWPGTDHTREYVPLLVFGPRVARGTDLGTRATLADLGATLAALWYLDWAGPGQSMLNYWFGG